jgi:Protein of unknown function (DUF2934)
MGFPWICGPNHTSPPAGTLPFRVNLAEILSFASLRPMEENRFEQYRRELTKKLAYQYWERRGRPLGSPEIDWASAERAIDPYLLASGQESPTLQIRLEPDENPFR